MHIHTGGISVTFCRESAKQRRGIILILPVKAGRNTVGILLYTGFALNSDILENSSHELRAHVKWPLFSSLTGHSEKHALRPWCSSHVISADMQMWSMHLCKEALLCWFDKYCGGCCTMEQGGKSSPPRNHFLIWVSSTLWDTNICADAHQFFPLQDSSCVRLKGKKNIPVPVKPTIGGHVSTRCPQCQLPLLNLMRYLTWVHDGNITE